MPSATCHAWPQPWPRVTAALGNQLPALGLCFIRSHACGFWTASVVARCCPPGVLGSSQLWRAKGKIWPPFCAISALPPPPLLCFQPRERSKHRLHTEAARLVPQPNCQSDGYFRRGISPVLAVWKAGGLCCEGKILLFRAVEINSYFFIVSTLGNDTYREPELVRCKGEFR